MNMSPLRLFTLAMLVPGLVMISGCGKRQAQKSNQLSEINIPTAQDGVKMFDESIGEFALGDDVARAQESNQDAMALADAQINADDFAWIDQEGAEGFKKDDPNTTIKFYDTGHFALETHGKEISQDILEFMAKLPK